LFRREQRWDDVDLAAGVIHVERSWDTSEGEVEPKRAGRRVVPIPAALREELLAWKLRSGRRDGYVFAREDGRPFTDTTIRKRGARVWKAAGLAPIGLHEARHTYASLMIAAGVNACPLDYVGHSSVTITLDRYGHLMPGNEDEAAALLDAYLERSTTAARLEAVAD
jgi:integrase